jgi:hypothetical protein
MVFYGTELLPLVQSPKLKDHPLSSVREWSNIFAAGGHFETSHTTKNCRIITSNGDNETEIYDIIFKKGEGKDGSWRTNSIWWLSMNANLQRQVNWKWSVSEITGVQCHNNGSICVYRKHQKHITAQVLSNKTEHEGTRTTTDYWVD